VSNIDRLSVAAIPSRFRYRTIANRANRSASLGGKINAIMGQIGFKNWMKSRFGELGGEAGNIKIKS